VRAANQLGYGPFTPDRTVASALLVGDFSNFPTTAVVAPLVTLLVLVLICFAVWRYTDLPKVLAPRLRKIEEKEDPLEEFIVREETPMEDFDPDLTLNPVVLAKLQVEKDRQAKRKGKKGAAAAKYATDNRGALFKLARAGFGVNETQVKKPETKEEKNQAGFAQIDELLDAQLQAAREQAVAEGADVIDIRPKQKVAMTLRTQAKQQKMRKNAEGRLVGDAKATQLAANKAQMARAAAKLPTLAQSTQSEVEE